MNSDLGVRTSHDLRHAAEAKAHYGGNRSIGHPGGEPTGYVAIGSLKVDTRGTDGAR